MNVLENLPTKEEFQLFPIKVDLEDVQSYVNQGWRYRPTSILTSYKEDWTEWYAIREFVQNSLDETGSFDLVFEDEEEISYIVDQGQGIDIMDMFLGQQKGATDEEIHCLRGVFGEGMKLALIPLLNAGNQVIIRTAGMDYFFCYIEEVSARKGAFNYIGIFTRSNQITKGTAVAIDGIDCLKYMKFFAPAIAKTDPEKVILTVTGGSGEYDHCKVRQVFDIPGMIFVRDIFVQQLDALFGYNFWFDSTRDALGSDRNKLKSIWEARRELAKLILGNGESSYLNELITRLHQPTFRGVDGEHLKTNESLEWKCLDTMDQYLDGSAAVALYSAILVAVGEDFSWSENVAEQKALEHAHIKDLRDTLPSFRKLLVRHQLIRDPKDIMKAAELTDETIIFTVDDILSAPVGDEEDRKDLAQNFQIIDEEAKCLLKYITRSSEVKLHFYIGEYKDEERIPGFYRVPTKEIYLRVKTIKDFDGFMRTFIHETAHAHCHQKDRYTWDEKPNMCGDLSQEFETSLEEVASLMVHETLKGRNCNIDNLSSAIGEIWGYSDLLDGIIQHKLQIVNNPKGLIRPKHASDRDKVNLDETFTRIAKGCYTTPNGIKAVLSGYAPNKNSYELAGWGCRDQSHDPLAIANKDKEIVKRLGLDIPPQLRQLSEEKLDDWKTWVNGDYPDEPPYERPGRASPPSRWMYDDENFKDFEACRHFFVNHPDPRVKKRNFKALLDLLDDQEQYEIILPDIINVVEQDAAFYACLQHNEKWYWASLKETIIQAVPQNKEVAAATGWDEILRLTEKLPHPDNRRYTATAYSHHNNEAALLRMLKREYFPNVMEAIIRRLSDVLGAYNSGYHPKDGPEARALKAILVENYDHIFAVSEDDSDDGWTHSARKNIKWWLSWLDRS